MSYCRFSTNDFQCDVYVYASVHGGYTTHVAGNRVIYTSPLPRRIVLRDDPYGYVVRMRQVGAMVEAAQRESIRLPHAGTTFNDSTPAACADRLEKLSALGYRVPQSAIAALREEMACATASNEDDREREFAFAAGR